MTSPEIVAWLVECGPQLADHWVHELRARDVGQGNGIAKVLEDFAKQLVGMLPLTIGPYREQIRPLWDRAAVLYGAVAAKRGLAAGEAIEELHVLRELVIRELYRNPPGNCSAPLSLREFLRLSRSLDRAVTHASVGHTDALFFEFFEGDGGEAAVLAGDDVAGETESQLDEIRGEVGEIVRHGPQRTDGGATEN
ncbi:MAG: hypothetical protein R3304_10715 [Longimicrobiales bacterium]|nr:hypothetical protein [Longimicrobiales bacterium]